MNNPVHRQRIMKCGWLKKQGGVVKTWHRRWFCLNGDCLFYFAKEDDLRPLGSIFLPGNRVSEIPHNPEEVDKYFFEISPEQTQEMKFVPGKMQNRMAPNHDSFLLWAVSDQERQAWIKIIRKVMYSSFGGAIFGQSIEETMEYEKKRGRRIPYIIEQCIEFLTEYGLETEGIFRLPGRNLVIKEFKQKFDCAEKVVFDISQVDVHTVASLLKLYLRELPQSVIPADHYQKFMNIALRYQSSRDSNDKKFALDDLKEAICKIPEENYEIVAYLCRFLAKVANSCEINKMTITNLATVFGPNIIRNVSEADSAELLMATADITQQLVFMMVTYHDEVFIDETPKSDIPIGDLLGLDPADEPEGELLQPVTLMQSISEELQGLEMLNNEAENKESETIDQTKLISELINNSVNNNEKSTDTPIPPQRKKNIKRRDRVSNRRRHENRQIHLSSTSSASDDLDPSLKNLSEEPQSPKYLETSFEIEDPLEDSECTVDQLKAHIVSLQKQMEINNQRYQLEVLNLTRQCSEVEGKNEELTEALKVSAHELNVQKKKSERQDKQIKELSSHMSTITKRYESRISTMDSSNKATLKALQEKYDNEQKTRKEAVGRVINLQAQLQQYQLQFGEIGN